MAHLLRSELAMELPKITADAQFSEPSKKIHSSADVKKFHESKAAFQIGILLDSISNAVVSKRTNDGQIKCSENVNRILSLLDLIQQIIEDSPPIKGPRRFGNIAFRTWLSKSKEVLSNFPEIPIESMKELFPYFEDSFGSSERLDYGTGHELNFAAFICGLFLIRFLTPGDDDTSVGLFVFKKYFELVRLLVVRYSLEPAGSHGVWGLDDHSFLPYMFGSSQLRESDYPSPSSVERPEIVKQYEPENHYFAAVAFIYRVKRGPFHEHSPTLFDISGVLHWQKIYQGMRKMYHAEVLSKAPVVQHFVFGSALFPFEAL